MEQIRYIIEEHLIYNHIHVIGETMKPTVRQLYDENLDRTFDLYIRNVFKQDPEHIFSFMLEHFLKDFYTGQEFLIHYCNLKPELIDKVMERWKEQLLGKGTIN